ncbi:rRNA maturation RNase YbeY [Treponema sp. J25]|uniref:rRNA maturation RNase YbeY n=1 Tax=Treponema sp. J25 TaxID=2094121 RepID=UPI00104CA5AA|nr:rRNA maturation RNase YbeY [Treponema sp. J25]TCW60067.1 rRNA maturation RNase YbeY [Treponema sp. J25]
MNRVALVAEDCELPPWSSRLESFMLRVLEVLKKDRWEVSLVLCTNKLMTQLNSQYRGKNESTDVLSFALGETYQDEEGEEVFLAGDLVISLETLEENARYFNVSVDEELRRLVIHGILHLAGMDHATNDQKEPMLILQEQILAELSEEKVLL